MSSAATSRSAARGGRALCLLTAALVTAAGALFGGVGDASATTLAACSVSISAPVATPGTVPAGSPTTYTATVTASTGCANGSPSGNVNFYSNYIVGGLPQAFQLGTSTTVVPTATPGQSIATMVDSSLPMGSFVITATFKSSDTSVFLNSGTSAGTSVVISSSSPLTTSMNLSESATTIPVGQPVTFTVHINVLDQTGQVTNNVAAGLVDFSAGSAGGSGQFHFASLQLDSTGSLTFDYQGFVPGDYIVTASYLGNAADGPISGQLELHVLAPQSTATSTTVSATPSSFPSGVSTTFSATVTETGGTPAPAGGNVAFFAGPNASSLTSEGEGQTDANGVAQISAQNFQPGAYVVIARYLGDTTNNIGSSTSGATPFFVNTPAVTGTVVDQLSYTGDTRAAFDSTARLSAHLQDGGSGAIGGKTIMLALGQDTCTGTTDPFGNASCQIIVTQDPGQYSVDASFTGDGNWAPANASAPFTVFPSPSSLHYTGDTSGAVGGQATLSTTLTDGSALPGRTVMLTMGTQSCSGTTDGAGNVSCQITILQAPGSYHVTAAFGGDADFASSWTSTTFTVNASPTTTHAGAVGPVLAGTAATLTATVTPGAATGTVTFTTGATTLCTAALSGGAASCAATFAQPGSYPVTARYGGDGTFPSSSGTTSVLVYAFAPGGGSFVIGDKSATGSVTFWGAQWSTVNALSGGTAPNAFKGFALNGAACGAIWSTDPGNSSPPPAGPLPAYMAVIVTGTSTKSGAQISGSTVSTVIVKTNAGYDANLGHAGTGTVVATVCGG